MNENEVRSNSEKSVMWANSSVVRCGPGQKRFGFHIRHMLTLSQCSQEARKQVQVTLVCLFNGITHLSGLDCKETPFLLRTQYLLAAKQTKVKSL